MTPTKHTMSVLAQITSWIPDRIIENLARKHRIQTRSFSATSHVISMVYANLAHALSLNDICDSLSNHAGTLEQLRNCTPPSRNGLSHANKTRNADMAEELFWKVYESLSKQYPEFLSSSRNYPGLPHRFRTRTIRAVDSTTIQLTAFSMGWAKHRRQKAAAKMHTALNMRSFLPNFVIVKSAHDRLFTLMRAVLWNFFRLASLIECCDTVRERRKRVIRGSPETVCQPTFW